MATLRLTGSQKDPHSANIIVELTSLVQVIATVPATAVLCARTGFVHWLSSDNIRRGEREGKENI